MTVALALIGVWLASSLRNCQAQISFVTMNRNNTYIQTGDSTVNYNGSWFASTLNSTNPTDFNSVVMTYPGPGSPVTVPTSNPGEFLFESPTLPTQADMDSDFPAGSYVFDASGNMGPATANFSYSTDAYSLTIPSVAGTTLSSLQGMNPRQAFTVQLSPFVANPLATQTYIFFTVYDVATSNIAFNDGFLAASDTRLIIPADSLSPNVDYKYELIFSTSTGAKPGGDLQRDLFLTCEPTGSSAPYPSPQP